MYYSNGNYEAFADPKKPEGVDKKSAYIIGSGLAGLSAAVFLVRDAQMKGERIHVLEELPVAGGSLDGADRPNAGFVVRGGREMETTLNVCGICIVQFQVWKFQVHHTLTNTTGLIKKTLTHQIVV